MRRSTVLILCLSPLSLGAQSLRPVVFSELMWMGSTASTADEWVELYNRSAAEVDLDGWTITRLVAAGDKPMVRLTGTIRPGTTFLIANFSPDDPRSRLAAQPQMVTSSLSLPNSKLQLRLYDGDPEKGARLVDVADDGVGAPWPAIPRPSAPWCEWLWMATARCPQAGARRRNPAGGTREQPRKERQEHCRCLVSRSSRQGRQPVLTRRPLGPKVLRLPPTRPRQADG